MGFGVVVGNVLNNLLDGLGPPCGVAILIVDGCAVTKEEEHSFAPHGLDLGARGDVCSDVSGTTDGREGSGDRGDI